MAHLNWANETKSRVSLRLNDSFRNLNWWWYDRQEKQFEPIKNGKYVSSAAVVHGTDEGRKIVIDTVRGTKSILFIAGRTPGIPATTGKIVGSVMFNTDGRLLISDSPNQPLKEFVSSMNRVETTTVLGIVGFDGPATFNVCDLQSKDEDIIRLKENESKLFIPARYLAPTPAYDVETERQVMPGLSIGGGVRHRLREITSSAPTEPQNPESS